MPALTYIRSSLLDSIEEFWRAAYAATSTLHALNYHSRYALATDGLSCSIEVIVLDHDPVILVNVVRGRLATAKAENGTVVAATKCHDLSLLGEEPRSGEGVQIGLRAGVGEPEALEMKASAELLGKDLFLGGGCADVHADILENVGDG